MNPCFCSVSIQFYKGLFMKKLLLGAFVVGTIAISPTLYAQITRTFTVQGVLTDSTSKPVQDGNHVVTVRVYDKISGGEPL